MAKCLAPFFSTKFMELVEDHAALLMQEMSMDVVEEEVKEPFINTFGQPGVLSKPE